MKIVVQCLGKTKYEAKDLMVILWEVAENPDMLNILNNHNDRTAECSEGMERMAVDDEPEDEGMFQIHS